MSDEEQLRIYLDAYIDLYFRENSDVPEISAKFTAGWKDNKGSWEGQIESGKRGVYILISQEGEAVYIGTSYASKGMGSRLVAYRRKGFPDAWDNKPESVYLITVSKPYEAASLELYMISKMPHAYNKNGKLLEELALDGSLMP